MLTADKLLAMADSVGKARFDSDVAFRTAYAHAATAALGRPVVRVDLPAGTVVA